MSERADPGTATVWVFGYGSLVDPESLGSTLGRTVTVGLDFVEAQLTGWGRRWNYGVGHVTGRWVSPGGQLVDNGVIVALGVVPAPGELTNGVVARVTEVELARLDHRERDYDRVDVSEALTDVRSPGRSPGLGVGDRVVTYVPRASAIARYEAARDARVAGIRHTYWGLVDAAFAVLGPAQLHSYRSSTPLPDVPVVAVRENSQRRR